MQSRKVVDLGCSVVLALGVATALVACSDNDNVDLSDSSSSSGQGTGVVQTVDGPVQDKMDQDIREFLGIRYAAPPVGDFRWKPPQTPDKWTDVKDATQYAGRCSAGETIDLFGTTSTNEDCLFLQTGTPLRSMGFAPTRPIGIANMLTIRPANGSYILLSRS